MHNSCGGLLFAFLATMDFSGSGSRLDGVQGTPSHTPAVLGVAGDVAPARGLLPFFPSLLPTCFFFFLSFALSSYVEPPFAIIVVCLYRIFKFLSSPFRSVLHCLKSLSALFLSYFYSCLLILESLQPIFGVMTSYRSISLTRGLNITNFFQKRIFKIFMALGFPFVTSK